MGLWRGLVFNGILLGAVFLGTLGLVWGAQVDPSLIPVLSPPDYTEERWTRLREVFRTLAETPSGKQILSRAGEMIHQVRWGAVSKTDAVLTRQFDPSTGVEERLREVTVFLKEKQSIEESVLDLAHEMTHALPGPQWDPYDPNLDAAKYVRAVIDSNGGEVDALTNECTVALELQEIRGWNAGRCSKYSRTGDERISRAEIQKDFYRVGKWRRQVERALEQAGLEVVTLPLLSGQEAVFFSSTGRAPYPISLMREFADLNGIACGNTLKRLSTMSSSTDPNPQQARESTVRFLKKRCPASTLPELTRR